MSTKTTTSQEGSLSHYIQTKDKFGNPVNIPVIDARDGLAERMLGKQIIKAQSKSKYINFTEYHISRKKQS